jgi:alpha-1,6-mannosyltransferase
MWSHERVDGVLRSFLPGPWPVRAMADGWNRSTARRFDTIACSTLFAREEFDRIGWTRVAHVPLGVDLETFRPSKFSADRRAELLGDDDLLLVMCSRLSKEKRPDIAIETLRELLSRNVRARLVVMGSGPMQRRMNELSAGLPVTMLGHVSTREEVATLLACADVCLAPGPIETFGLAALEALACGTPVVASSSSALKEIVDGQAGYAVATDPKQFADAALSLAGRPEVSRRRAARQRAEHFPWSATVDRMLAVHKLGAITTPTLDATGAV